MQQKTVIDVREEFSKLFKEEKFTSVNRESTMTSLVGSRTIEIIGASFLADKEVIFGELNPEYLKREETWYLSMSRNVNDIPGGAPAVWKAIADRQGYINSNYGWCVKSEENGSQLDRVILELKKNPESRRAVIIYTRPSMWEDYCHDGRSDFMCTNVVQYVVRDGKCHSIVQMRSNDALIGYKNDKAWQDHVLKEISNEIGYEPGQIYWQVGSLHVYERNFYLVDHYLKTGEHRITKSRYNELYPDSVYSHLGE